MAGADTADPTAGSGGGVLGTLDRGMHRIEKLTALLSGIGSKGAGDSLQITWTHTLLGA